MAGELDVVRSFLWDNFLIDFNKKVTEDSKTASEDEKLDILENHILMNLFLLRRAADPGFFQYICREVLEDKEVLSLAKRYHQRVVADALDVDEELFRLQADSPKQEKETFDGEIRQPVTLPETSIGDLMEIHRIVSASSLKYFMWRLRRTLDIGDMEEARALEPLIHEYSTNRYMGYKLLAPTSPYKGTFSIERWRFASTVYLLTKIRFAMIYMNFIIPTSLEMHFLMPENAKLQTLVLEHVLHDMGESGGMEDIASLKKYNKLVNDFISVASTVWFNGKTKEEKLRVLNGSYSFSVEGSMLDGFPAGEGKQSIIHLLATVLYRKGHLKEAREVYQYLYPQCDDDLCRYSCEENIAVTYRDEERHEKALQWFLKCLESLSKMKTEPTYEHARELKNIGEMYLQLGDMQRSQDCFGKVRGMMGSLTEKEKARILWNLANAYRRCHEFEQEYATLNDIVGFSSETAGPELKDGTHNRLLEIQGHMDPSRGGALDYEALRVVERRRKYSDLLLRGKKSLSSFQLANALKWFRRACDYSDGDHEARAMLATTYFIEGDYDSARTQMRDIIEDRPDEYTARAFMGIIHLSREDSESGISELAQAIRNCVESKSNVKRLVKSVALNLAIVHKLGALEHLAGELARQMPETYKEALFYEDAGTALTDMGFFEEGLEHYDKALKGNPSNDTRARIMNNIGTSHANQDSHSRAVEYYEQAISEKEDYAECWFNMSTSYGYLLNFHKAIECIDEALRLSPGHSGYEPQKRVFEELSQSVLNINSAKDEEVRYILTSAETVLQQLSNVIEPIEISSTFMPYCKAVEIILDREVSAPISAEIWEQYADKNDPKRIRNDLWRARGIQGLPHFLRGLLRAKRQISIEAWGYALAEVEESHSNPIVEHFRKSIVKRFSAEDRETIATACLKLAEHRPASAHKGTKTIEEMLSLRSMIVDSLNNVIRTVYGD